MHFININRMTDTYEIYHKEVVFRFVFLWNDEVKGNYKKRKRQSSF